MGICVQFIKKATVLVAFNLNERVYQFDNVPYRFYSDSVLVVDSDVELVFDCHDDFYVVQLVSEQVVAEVGFQGDLIRMDLEQVRNDVLHFLERIHDYLSPLRKRLLQWIL